MRGRVALSFCLVFFGAWSALAQERITEIRVHGNHTTPDAEVILLSGLHVGDDPTDTVISAASHTLRASGRFEDVDIRKRFLSIADASQVLIMIVVQEHAGVSSDDPIPGPLHRFRAATMWLPVLAYADGYGFTYGARLAFVDVAGPGTHASIPLTWGGERRAGVDVDRTFGETPGVPALRLVGGVAASRRVNPFFDAADTRIELHARAEHAFTSWVRIGGAAQTRHVSFSPRLTPPASGDGSAALVDESDRHDAIGGDVTLDTRIDPSFPRNAVYARFGVERLAFGTARASRSSARRQTADLRGYIGIGRPVVGLRGLFLTSDSALPHSEQRLLGGADVLRGYRAGYAADDNLAAVSAEVRLPLSSPLSVGRFGVKAFVDWGTTWAADARLRDQQWNRGVGGGVYFGAGPLIADIALAWPEHGGPRGHFSLGVSF